MTITLTAKHKSGFLTKPLTPFTFPAGEAHIKGDEDLKFSEYEYFIADVRGHDPQDLFHLAMWAETLHTAAVDEGGEAKLIVLLPYLPGARADRGNPLGAGVYADFINSISAHAVIAVDPHSHVMPNLINRLTVFPFERIIKHEIQNIESDSKPQPYVGVIAPDKGAHNRAAAAAHVMGVPVYTAGKTRDFETGAITNFHMEDELPAEGKFLLVDDICDGGGTFIGLAAAIEKTNPNVELDLWVTHGIFSKGLVPLSHKFGTIHTTDSYPQDKHLTSEPAANLKVHLLGQYLYGEVTNV